MILDTQVNCLGVIVLLKTYWGVQFKILS